MGTMALRIDFPSQRKCDQCHRGTKSLYQINLDGYHFMVCSARCAEISRQNWQYKKDHNITPENRENIQTPTPEMLDDNIDELVGD